MVDRISCLKVWRNISLLFRVANFHRRGSKVLFAAGTWTEVVGAALAERGQSVWSNNSLPTFQFTLFCRQLYVMSVYSGPQLEAETGGITASSLCRLNPPNSVPPSTASLPAPHTDRYVWVLFADNTLELFIICQM